jgi:hypothetical protein
VSSETYRYYCLDATGHLHNAHWFSAESDEEAVAHVRAKHPDGKCEVWHEQRFVAALAPNVTNRMVDESLRTLSQSRRLLRETAALTTQPYQPS